MRPDEAIEPTIGIDGDDAAGDVHSADPSSSTQKVSVRNPIAFLTAAIGVLAVGLILLISALQRPASSEEFIGTLINPPVEALDFSLTNQRGERVTLSELRGKPVVLTFLYTSCTDVCPFVGIKLKMMLDALGDDAENIEVIAVSTDPERDTQDRIAEYSKTLGMFDRWSYVIGDTDQLTPIWDAYFIGQPITTDESVFATREDLDFFGLTTGLDEDQIGEANLARGQFGGGYDVSHVTPIWLIDTEGEIRVKMDTAGPPEDYVRDIRLMIGNS